MKTGPKLFSTVVPGDMDMEKWAAGGFSKFLHPEKDCSDEVIKELNVFKTFVLAEINHLVTIDNAYEMGALQEFIKNYKL